MNTKRSAFIGFIGRFSLVHTGTYLVFGLLFMFLSDYFAFFASDPLLNAVMRPPDSPDTAFALSAT